MLPFIFVEHSFGEFEGSVYDNVRLSDGIETMKIKNNSGKTDLSKTFPRGTKVICEFKITPSKGDKPQVVLTKIELAK